RLDFLDKANFSFSFEYFYYNLLFNKKLSFIFEEMNLEFFPNSTFKTASINKITTMKQTLQLLHFLVIGYTAKAQYTFIPDAGFEQELIYQNIDSDGVVNGQVLTSDIENVTELIMEDGYGIEDLTGIQDFTNLEKLVILYSEITELDVSQNLQLKILDCS